MLPASTQNELVGEVQLSFRVGLVRAEVLGVEGEPLVVRETLHERQKGARRRLVLVRRDPELRSEVARRLRLPSQV